MLQNKGIKQGIKINAQETNTDPCVKIIKPNTWYKP